MRRVALTATALVLLACSSSSSPSAAPTKDFATAYCERLATCAFGSLKVTYGDEATCRRVKAPAIDASLALSAGANGGACGAAYAAMSCDDFLSYRAYPPEACRFRGNTGNGTACGTDWQCASGFCAFTGSCGVCADAPKEGEPCSSGRCGPQLACSGALCVSPGLAGSACTDSSSCDLTLACVGGRCAASGRGGATCSGFDSRQCFYGFHCDSGTCNESRTLEIGEVCASSVIVLCAGSYCNAKPADFTGKCTAYVESGQPCGPDLLCRPGSTCTDGVCKIPDPAACR